MEESFKISTPSAHFAYHNEQCDRPHVRVEKWACRSGDVSPVESEEDGYGGAGAGETWCLMSDSKDYTFDQPLPPPPPPCFSPSSSLLQQDMAIDHSLPNSVLFNNDDRISSLERSVCSNFVCCGENLVDFHALIDHFEENHISIVSSTGKKLYPKSNPKPKLEITTTTTSSSRSSMSPTPELDSTATTPASSRSSSVVPSPPMPVTPLAPSSPSMSHDRAASPPPPPIAPHLPPAQSHLLFPTIEYNPYIGIIAPLSDEPSSSASSSSSFVALPPKVVKPAVVEVISAFGPEYDFARDYARYEEAWRRKTTREAEEAAAFEHAQLERELREAEEEEMERMGYSFSSGGEELDSLGLEGMAVIGEQATTTSRVRSSSQPPATNHGGKVPKTARPRPRVNTFLPRSSSSCPISSTSPSTPSSSSSSAGGPSRPKVTIPTIPNAPPVSLGKKREKAYKCPQRGCTKAYLNPNGLKYHLEKGTCKFDERLAFRGGFSRPAPVPLGSSTTTTTPSGPMEVEEESEEESARLERPPLQGGTSYPTPSVADGKSWMMPCAM